MFAEIVTESVWLTIAGTRVRIPMLGGQTLHGPISLGDNGEIP